MVAFVSGNGLGLGNSSSDILGPQGTVGNSSLGRSGDQVFVNGSTGNLVVQRQDDFLSVLGQDISVVRTYNSLGLADGDNNDGWRLGVAKGLGNLSGGINTAGSTITRTDGDGSVSVYTWSSTLQAYVSTDGAGSYDTLKYKAAADGLPASWTLTDGDSQATETYDWTSYTTVDDRRRPVTISSGKIISTSDADGNRVSYGYQAFGSGFLVTSLTAASGDKVEFAWDGGKLMSETTTAGGVAEQCVSYAYDTAGRLLAVNVAARQAGQWADAVDVTTFEYNGDGTLSSITGVDGSKTTFTYIAGKVQRVSQIVDGAKRSLGISYDTAAQTTITDSDGQTVLTYDTGANDNRLKSVKLPGGESYQYTYDANGNLTRLVDARNLVTTFGYDGRGNQLWSMDAMGNTVKRTFGARNELLSESLYLVPDADAAGTPAPATPLTTQYVYDSERHRRFVVSPQDRVTEYRYDSAGRRTVAIAYESGLYTGTALDESSLATWAAAQDTANTQLTRTAYDDRGNVSQVARYAAQGAQGAPAVTRYTYDRHGRLLTVMTVEGATTSYAYDSQGRVASSSGPDGITSYLYDDANNAVCVNRADGSRVVSVFNAAGELLSVTTTGLAGTRAVQTYAYDDKGRLRMTTDATGVRSYFLYDRDGRKIADIDASGSVVEHAYNGNGQVIATTRYATAMTAAQLASLVDANGRPAAIDIANVRPLANPAMDRRTWNLYDNAGRLAKTVSETGLVTETQYDGASRIIGTVRYATAVATGAITANTRPTDTVATPAASAADERTRYFRDDDGLLLATLDPSGALCENFYDAGGQLWKTVRYQAATASTSRASGTLAQLRPAADAAGRDIATFYFHDGEGRTTGMLDGERYFTETRYDDDGRILAETRYGTPAAIDLDKLTATTPISAQMRVGPATTTTYTYDDMGRVHTCRQADGAMTTYAYDELGRLETIQVNTATSDERTTQYTLDDLGRVTAETGPGGNTVHYEYDVQGRRVSSTNENGQRTLLYYDVDGRLACTIDPLGQVTWNTYDNLGQLVLSRRLANRLATAQLAAMRGGWAASVADSIASLANDAIDQQVAYTYTADGRISASTDELGRARGASYNTLGTVQYRVDENGNATRYVYDADERLVFELDAANGLVGYAYDTAGRLLKTTRYAQAVNPATVPPNVKGPVTLATLTAAVTAIADQARDASTTNIYDENGRAVFIATAAGAVDARSFDAQGNVIAETRYATSIALPASLTVASVAQAVALVADASRDESTWSTYDAMGRLVYRADGTGSVATYTYDANGQLTDKITYANRAVTPSARTLPPADASRDAHVRMFYDADGRVVKTATASGTDGGGELRWLIVSNTYDAAGHVLSTTEYATLQRDPAAPPAPDAKDRTVRSAYDALGRAVYRIDAEGAVTEYVYDTAGRVIQSRTCASATSQERVQRTVYDSAGRARYVLDTFGDVTEYTYDATGRVTQTRQYARPVAIAGNPSVAAMAATVAQDPADRVTRTGYDAAGRPVWSVDAQGAVTANTYDAQGRLTSTRVYAQTIAIASLPPGSAPNMAGAADAANDRFTQYVYDAEGRVAWRVDAGGFVTQTKYDARGRVTGSALYAAPTNVVAGVISTRAAIEAFVSTHSSAADQLTSNTYDAAGRVVAATDANGGVERFDYDGLGLRTSWTDKLSNVWTYLYDAAGRLTNQRSPLLDIAQVSAGANGQPVIGGQPMHTLETVTTYNAFGEVASRTEAFGTPQERTTTYEYDRDGRQVKTIFPVVEVFDGDVGAGGLGTTAQTPEVKVLYDALGNAVRNMAANGAVSWRVYDAEGRLAFEIDGAGGVTGYTRNAFGEVTALRRFAALKSVANGAPPTLAQMQAFATTGAHAGDRTITTAYDNAGRVVKVVEPSAYSFDAATGIHGEAAKATSSIYNAFGELIKQSATGQLASGATTGPVADTYFSWNVRGLQIARIDVVERVATTDKGYLTTMAYDAAGRLVDRIEYATQQNFADASFNPRTGMVCAIPVASADDRRMQYAFDGNGNLLAETRLNVAYSTSSDGSETSGNVVTTYTYDAAGHLLSTADATGATTVTSYDALGRATAVATYSRDARKRQVAQIYLALAARAPTAAELADGITKAPPQVAQALLAGAANGQSAGQFLSSLYSNLVGRAPDPGGMESYLPEITSDNRAQFALAMIGRFSEAMNQDTAVLSARTSAAIAGTSLITATQSEQRRLMIASLYAAILGRAPDPSGMAFYMTNGATDVQIAAAMFAGTEAQALYPAGTSAWEVAARIYYATHGEAGDDAMLAALAAQATADRANWGALAVQQVNAVLGGPGSSALLYFTNKMMADLAEGADVFATPGTLTKFLLDAYGNAVQKIEYAAGAVDGVDIFRATPAADRMTSTRYDAAGHALQEWDAQGHARTTAYDIDGHAVADLRVGQTTDGQAQALYEIRKCDVLGRLVEIDKPGEQEQDARVVTTVNYNAFGEMTSRSVNGAQLEYADYDNAGHLWRTNADDGVDKVYLYDVFGNRSAQILDADDSLKTVASAAAAVTGDWLIETDYAYDLQGRVVSQKSPTQYASDVGESRSGTPVAIAQSMTLGYAVTQQAGLSDYTVGDNTYQQWSGTNNVRVSWASLAGLGAGDVRVELTYVDGDGKLAVQVRDFRADEALTGQDLSWDDAAPVQTVQRVKVYKKSLSGDWQALIDSTAPGKLGTLLRVAAPADPNVATKLQYRLVGAGAWTDALPLPRFGDAYVFDTARLPEGAYEYQVLVGGGAQPRDTGTIGVVNQNLREQIARLYAALLNRSADTAGMGFYAGAVSGGTQTLADVARALYQSPEQDLANKSSQDVVTFLLASAFDRSSPTWGGELASRALTWTTQLNMAATPEAKAAILADIVEQVAAYTGGDADMLAARDLLAKKTAVSLAYAIDDVGYVMGEARAMMAQLNATGDVQAALTIGRESLLRRQVAQLYVAILNRAPDAGGLDFYVQSLKGGATSLAQVASDMLGSDEARADLLYWNADGTQVSDAQFVTNVYAIAGRTATAWDISWWSAQLQTRTRAQVLPDMADSIANYGGPDAAMFAARQVFNNKVSIALTYAHEVGGTQQGAEEGLIAYATGAGTALDAAKAAVQKLQDLAAAAQSAETTGAIVANSAPMEEYRRQIAQLYAILLDRVPDAAGMAFYCDGMESHLSATDMATDMIASKEGRAKYASLGDSAFASSIFAKVFGRPPSAAELSYWAAVLAGTSRGAMARQLIDSLVYSADPATLTARQLLANKTAVGIMYSVDLGGTGDGAAGLMTLVTATDTTAAINQAIAAVTSNAQKAANAAWSAAQAANNKAATSYAYADALADYMAASDASAAVASTTQSEQFTQVAQLYRAIFNRTAGYDELDFYFNAMQQGWTQVQIADNFFQSPEGVGSYGGLANDAFLTKIYANVLNRPVDASGRTFWLAALNSGQSRGTVLVGIVNGLLNYSGTDANEYANKALFQLNVANLLAAARSSAALHAYNATRLAQLTTAALKEARDCAMYDADTRRCAAMLADSATLSGDALSWMKLAQLYRGGLGRDADLSGVMFYADTLKSSGATLDDVAQSFVDSDEGKLLYGGKTDTQFIDTVYRQTFGRAVDASGLATWLKALSSGRTRGQVMRGIVESLANYGGVGAKTDEMARKAAFLGSVGSGLSRLFAAASAYKADPYGTFVQNAAGASSQLAASVDRAEVNALNASAEAKNRKSILQLHTLMFNRAPTLAAMNAWAAQMAGGATAAQIAAAMLASPEGASKFPAGTSATAFVTAIFQGTFGRPPSAANLNAYASGSLAQIATNMAAKVSAYAGTSAADIELRLVFGDKVMVNAVAAQAGAHDAVLAAQATASEAAKVLAMPGHPNFVPPVDAVRSAGWLSSNTSGVQQSGAAPVVTRTYDRWGNLASETDARNAAWVTRYKYNALDEVKSVTDPLNHTTQLYYDAAGRNVATRDANGNVSGLVHDAQGDVVEEIHADGGTVQYRFDAFGEKTLQRGADGQVVAYAYDSLGQLRTITHGVGVMVDAYATVHGIDPGDVVSWHPADASWVGRTVLTETYDWDDFGRRTGYTDAMGYKSITYYDLRGNVIETKDALGRATTYGYDALDRKVRQGDANGLYEQWDYDVAGRLQSRRDMNGKLMGFTYNVFTGWLTEQHSDYGQMLAYTYDMSSGLLVRIEDRSVAGQVQVAQYAYDLGGRRLREKTSTIDTATGKEIDVAQDNHIAYDEVGRELHVQDGRYDVQWTYDAVGNRTSQRTRYRTLMSDGTEQSVDRTTWNAFDAMNREVVVDGVSGDGGKTVRIDGSANSAQGQQIAYDSAGNRIHVTQWAAGLVSTGNGSFTASSGNIRTSETSFYDAAGRLQTVYREGAVADARRYDQDGRLLETGQIGLDNIDAVRLEAMGIAAQTNQRLRQRRTDAIAGGHEAELAKHEGHAGSDHLVFLRCTRPRHGLRRQHAPRRLRAALRLRLHQPRRAGRGHDRSARRGAGRRRQPPDRAGGRPREDDQHLRRQRPPDPCRRHRSPGHARHRQRRRWARAAQDAVHARDDSDAACDGGARDEHADRERRGDRLQQRRQGDQGQLQPRLRAHGRLDGEHLLHGASRGQPARHCQGVLG
jgi:YD repeat-containing protein